MDRFDVFPDAQDEMAAAIFADAQQVPFDGDGRIILPGILLEHAGLKYEVAFVGRGSTFQLWHPQVFESVQHEARQRLKDSRLVMASGEGKAAPGESV